MGEWFPRDKANALEAIYFQSVESLYLPAQPTASPILPAKSL